MRAAALAARVADAAAGMALAAHVLAGAPDVGTAVAGYWPIGTEIDVRPLLRALHARGHAIGLPVTPRAGLPLTFRRWTPDTPLVPGRFGTFSPHGDGPPLIPGWLLVPLLAFDDRGRRLGYGGGYYDRTLAGLPDATALGCAYASQRVDAVPVDAYDAPLHAVATERGILKAHHRP